MNSHRSTVNQSLSVKITDHALVLGATMRLTRLIVTDDIGHWWVRQPLLKLAHKHTTWEQVMVGTEPDTVGTAPRWARYLDGLDCPYCVGFWIGAGVLASHKLARLTGPRALAAWRFVASTLALNEVAAKANVLMGDV